MNNIELNKIILDQAKKLLNKISSYFQNDYKVILVNNKIKTEQVLVNFTTCSNDISDIIKELTTVKNEVDKIINELSNTTKEESNFITVHQFIDMINNKLIDVKDLVFEFRCLLEQYEFDADISVLKYKPIKSLSVNIKNLENNSVSFVIKEGQKTVLTFEEVQSVMKTHFKTYALYGVFKCSKTKKCFIPDFFKRPVVITPDKKISL